MKIIDGGITAGKNFYAAGIFAGIKKRKKDLAIIYSDRPCSFAGTFTTNLVQAAPVLWDRQIVEHQPSVQAIVINSGNANACTAAQGDDDCQRMASLTAEALNLQKEAVLVCSTGVIGVPLPMQQISEGIAVCAKAVDGGRQAASDAAHAILTTDTFVKEIALSIEIDGVEVTIGGMAKGSGMIHPNMATMLSFITTDAAVEKESLQRLLESSIGESYNMISIDGDTSTNDTVLVLANGASGSQVLNEKHPQWKIFKEAFDFVNTALAKLIVRDGEGASKFLEVSVEGAADTQSARTLVRSILSSNLVKTAFFGSDANWGRILCAMGYSGASFNPRSVDLFFGSEKGTIQVVKAGQPVAFDEKLARAILMEREVRTMAYLQEGEGRATGWGCDLSYEYVRINGEYRS